MAFKKLSFDCLNESLNSLLREASSFAFSKAAYHALLLTNFFLDAFFYDLLTLALYLYFHVNILYCFPHVTESASTGFIWVKVFRNGPSKIC